MKLSRCGAKIYRATKLPKDLCRLVSELAGFDNSHRVKNLLCLRGFFCHSKGVAEEYAVFRVVKTTPRFVIVRSIGKSYRILRTTTGTELR